MSLSQHPIWEDSHVERSGAGWKCLWCEQLFKKRVTKTCLIHLTRGCKGSIADEQRALYDRYLDEWDNPPPHPGQEVRRSVDQSALFDHQIAQQAGRLDASKTYSKAVSDATNQEELQRATEDFEGNTHVDSYELRQEATVLAKNLSNVDAAVPVIQRIHKQQGNADFVKKRQLKEGGLPVVSTSVERIARKKKLPELDEKLAAVGLEDINARSRTNQVVQAKRFVALVERIGHFCIEKCADKELMKMYNRHRSMYKDKGLKSTFILEIQKTFKDFDPLKTMEDYKFDVALAMLKYQFDTTGKRWIPCVGNNYSIDIPKGFMYKGREIEVGSLPSLSQICRTYRTLEFNNDLSPERFKLLDEIGFVWGRKVVFDDNDKKWISINDTLYPEEFVEKSDFKHVLYPETPDDSSTVFSARSREVQVKCLPHRLSTNEPITIGVCHETLIDLPPEFHKMFRKHVMGALLIMTEGTLNGRMQEWMSRIDGKHTGRYLRSTFIEPSAIRKAAKDDPRLEFFADYAELLEQEGKLYLVASIAFGSGKLLQITCGDKEYIHAMMPHTDGTNKGPMINSRWMASFALQRYTGSPSAPKNIFVSEADGDKGIVSDCFMEGKYWWGGPYGKLYHCGGLDYDECSLVNQIGGRNVNESTSRDVHMPILHRLYGFTKTRAYESLTDEELECKKLLYLSKVNRENTDPLTEFKLGWILHYNQTMKNFYYGK